MPERIDPGISKYKLINQTKIISGSNNKSSLRCLITYMEKIIKKKLYATKDIKTAEVAKIIENTQRIYKCWFR